MIRLGIKKNLGTPAKSQGNPTAWDTIEQDFTAAVWEGTMSKSKNELPGNINKMEYFRNLALKHLYEMEKGNDFLQKSVFFILEKSKTKLPVGTIRTWADGKTYIKLPTGKWRPKYNSQSRGAKIAIAHIKKRIESASTEQELLGIMLENRERFVDSYGYPLPFMQELSNYIRQKGDNLSKKEDVEYLDKPNDVISLSKENKPDFLEGYWNGKIYGDNNRGWRIYLSGTEKRINGKQKKELDEYLDNIGGKSGLEKLTEEKKQKDAILRDAAFRIIKNDVIPTGKYWNGKIYGYNGEYKVYIDGKEKHLTRDQNKVINDYIESNGTIKPMVSENKQENVTAKKPESKKDNKENEGTGFFQIGGGSGYGYSEYIPNTVIKNPRYEEGNNEPKYIYVVSASKKYYKYDGLSFGVGDEYGYVYSAKVRPATKEESKELEKEDTDQEKRIEIKIKYRDLENKYRKNGISVSSKESDGTFLHDRFFNGFTIGKDYIWYEWGDGDGFRSIWKMPFNKDDADLIRQAYNIGAMKERGMKKSLCRVSS